MRTVYEREIANAIEINGRLSPTGKSGDRIVRTLVGPVCRVIWPPPLKTDVEVALICKCDPRNARRYMSGELPIPAVLLAAINVELVKRFE